MARYGVVFETARGPKVQWRPGTFEFDAATGRFDRGGMVPTASTRAARIRDTCKTLGVALQLMKMVLFAQLASVLATAGNPGTSSSSGGATTLWQVIPLMTVTLLYWTYMRLFAPMASLADLAAEVRRHPQAARAATHVPSVCRLLAARLVRRTPPLLLLPPPGAPCADHQLRVRRGHLCVRHHRNHPGAHRLRAAVRPLLFGVGCLEVLLQGYASPGHGVHQMPD